MAASKLDDLTRGATDTAANVKDFHVTLDADTGS